MSSRPMMVAQAVATLVALFVIAGVLWWAVRAPDVESGERLVPTPEADEAASDADRPGNSPTSGATAVESSASGDDSAASATSATSPPSTPTTAPSPTPIPDPVPFTEVIGRVDLESDLQSPLPACGLVAGTTVAGTVGIRCVEELGPTEVVPVAAGRIVHIGREDAAAADPAVVGDPGWSWSRQLELGRHVVVDHGIFAGSRNVQTVYARLDSIADDLVLGAAVEQTTPLGRTAGSVPEFGFSLWVDGVRQDGAAPVLDGPDVDTQRLAAAALAPLLVSPTDPLCPLSLGGTQLPGAPRSYRNGIHQGIDFGCGTSDRFGHAIADGRVVFLVDDYEDPTVADREQLLRNAGLAGFTPHWTLVMLYGNVVVIDHGEVAGAGRVYSIAAHLESVAPGIRLGDTVSAGQVLGELGNRGTNAAAQGLRGADDPSLHLHWELFIDNWYLGSNQPTGVVVELVTTALCGAAATPGCPG